MPKIDIDLIEQIIQDFNWGNYGFDEVEIGIADYRDDQEWIKDLAEMIWDAL